MEEEEKAPDTPQEENEETPESGSDDTSPDEPKAGRREARLERRRGRRIGRRGGVIILIIIGFVVGFLILRRQSPTVEIEPDETTSIDETSPTTTPTASSEPINKEEITIQVLNGTGIAKEASFLQGQLEDLGYSQIDLGNADSEDFVVTKVTFASSLSQEVTKEITSELEEIYDEVDTKTTDTKGDYLVQIITGYRKGHTPTPTLTPTPQTSPTPTATSSATPTLTPTP